ncbi:uncharacterized protein VTP21DRAFT_1827 [Calcarisporiella thermophila]|uniref:uncharacterized protein n=1 Tax=Calcarisporiella thermophila TaxID=911321 RepID=UPI00374383DA
MAFSVSEFDKITHLLGYPILVKWSGVIAALFTIVVCNYLRLLIFRDNKIPPQVPYFIPFIGSLLDFGLDPLGFLQKNRKKYGDYFTFNLAILKVTVCLGVEGNNLVFNAKHSHVSAEDIYTNLTTPLFGTGVVYDCPNALLMEQKKFMKFGLTTENFRAYVPAIEEETRQYLQRWNKKSDRVDLGKAMAELTIMTASRCLMGKEVRSLLDETVAGLFKDLDNGFQPINAAFKHLPLPSYWRRDTAHVKMRNLFMDIMKKRRATGDMNNNDIMQSLMDQEYKSGQKVTDQDVAHMMIALLMAGQHSSSATSSWSILHIAKDRKLLNELREEQIQVLGSLNEPLSYDKLKELQLHDHVIRESLRMYPPIIMVLRKVKQDLPIPNTNMVIPKGHCVSASAVISQYDDKYFEDPLTYNPHRWETITEADDVVNEDYGWGTVTGGRSPYLPFGAGRHRCIGETFAYVQLKSIIATFVRMFDVELTEKGLPKVDYTKLFTGPVAPAEVIYTRRNEND